MTNFSTHFSCHHDLQAIGSDDLQRYKPDAMEMVIPVSEAFRNKPAIQSRIAHDPEHVAMPNEAIVWRFCIGS